MIKKLAIQKHLLADGDDADIAKNDFRNTDENGKVYRVHIDNLKHLDELGREIDREDFTAIIKDGNFLENKGFIKVYRGSDDLQLYYNKEGNIISVYAFGEFQPARYKLYLEGRWEIK
ncbi:hypothetical protein ACTHGU_09235 [Chitinophagaceae bacterium MMS25-I14]